MIKFLIRFIKPHVKGKTRQQRKSKPTTLSKFLPKASLSVSRSTSENYRTAVRSFIRFNNGKDLALIDITSDTLHQYERWLAQQGICPNTSSCYMRSLRAIYNKAIEKKRIKPANPFRNIFTGNEKNVKRTVSRAEINKIQALDTTAHAHLTLTRDLFLFTLYGMGIPFADLAHLQKSNITNGILTYRRKKTGKKITLRLEPCLLQIISKYTRTDTPYLFPILYNVKKEKLQYQNYATALSAYNRHLKALALKAGIPSPLTSYTARHSWASLAYEQNIDLPVISKALGHTDTKTTLIYIADIKDHRVEQANKKLLKGLTSTPLTKR